MSKPLIAMWVGIGLLVLSWIFPPWRAAQLYDGRPVKVEDIGFHSIFSRLPTYGDNKSFRVDYGRLALIDMCLVAVAAGATLSLRSLLKNLACGRAD